MKIFSWVFLAILLFGCQKNDPVGQSYSLIQYSGTIAGITKTFPKGQCTWEITESTINIDIDTEDPFVRDMQTGYTKSADQNSEFWMIDSLGQFMIARQLDTLFLVAPCCDFINYTLVRD